MPYLSDLEDDDLEQRTQKFSAGEQVLGAGANTAAKSQNSPQKGSGNFADLNEYLRVNSPQGFGSQLAEKVGADVTKAQQTLSGVEQDFKSRADQGVVRSDSNLVSEATGDNAADFVKDANKVKAFEAQRDATYKGPSSLADSADLYSQASGAAQTATGKAKAASSEGGRFALLENYFGRDNYNSGQKALDNLLVQNDQNSRQAFKQVEDNANAVANQQRNLETTASQYGANAKAITDNTKKTAREALGIDDSGNLVEGKGALGGLRKSIDDRTASRSATFDQDVEAISKALADRDASKLTEAQKKIFGTLTGEQTLYNLDPSNYLTQENRETAITKDTTANAEERARLKALQQLADIDEPWLDESVENNEGKALYDFDEARFAQDQAVAAKEFEGRLNETAQSNLGRDLGLNFPNTGNAPIKEVFRQYLDPSGNAYQEIKAIEDEAARYGVSPNQWPAYPGMKAEQQKVQGAFNTLSSRYGTPNKLKV